MLTIFLSFSDRIWVDMLDMMWWNFFCDCAQTRRRVISGALRLCISVISPIIGARGRVLCPYCCSHRGSWSGVWAQVSWVPFTNHAHVHREGFTVGSIAVLLLVCKIIFNSQWQCMCMTVANKKRRRRLYYSTMQTVSFFLLYWHIKWFYLSDNCHGSFQLVHVLQVHSESFVLPLHGNVLASLWNGRRVKIKINIQSILWSPFLFEPGRAQVRGH